MVVSKQFDYSKTSKNALQYRRTSQFIVNLAQLSDDAFDL